VKVIYGIDSPQIGAEPRVLTLGAYDGIHRGHQSLFDVVAEVAAETGGVSTALTFEPIPAEVFSRQGSHNIRLTLLDEKLEQLAAQNLDTVIVAQFDERFRNISARDFAQDIIKGKLNTQVLVASETHTFGRGGQADIHMIRQLGEELGFAVYILPLFTVDGGRHVSSSRIRQLLWQGCVQEAAELLGRPYSIRGRVVSGRGVGRQLGFPTANLQLPEAKLIPADGVYAAVARWEGCDEGAVAAGGIKGCPAAVSIGTSPTFGRLPRAVEVHIIGAEVELEGKSLEVHFIARLRGQRAFVDMKLLAAQIRQDLEDARGVLVDNRISLAYTSEGEE